MNPTIGFVYKLMLTKTLDTTFDTQKDRINYIIREFTFQYDNQGTTVDLKPCSDFFKKYGVK
jgi:hypothetical protein